MTAITTPSLSTPGLSTRRPIARTTVMDRALLLTASALDAFVAGRVERRSAAERRRALVAQDGAAGARTHAQTLGAMGMLPR